MELLSSRFTVFYKRVFPVVWLFLVLGTAWMAVPDRMWERDPLFFVGPVLMLVIGIFIFRAILRNLADEVRDAGNAIVVRKGAVEVRIPITDIVNIEASQFSNPRRLSLRLRTPGKLGDEITFIPPASIRQFSPFARNPIAESLIKRVDAARQGLAR